MKTCAFTGHRDLPENFDRRVLERRIENLAKNGVEKFLCGMALGFDMLCAEIVLKLKEKYDIKLVACLPCENQQIYYPSAQKLRYAAILEKCDEKKLLAPSYFAGCMHRRDRYMVENSDVVLAYLTRNSGGTYYTVNYANSSGVPVINIGK